MREKLVELPIDDAILILKEELKQRTDGYTTHLSYGGKGDPAEEVNLDALAMAISALEHKKWISVKDRLPEKCPQPYDDMTKWCLLYTPVDGCMHIGWYTGKDYRGRDRWRTLSAMRSYQTCTKKVSHWMHLPQPPKGE